MLLKFNFTQWSHHYTSPKSGFYLDDMLLTNSARKTTKPQEQK